MDLVWFLLGLFLLILVAWDVFETIVVPRPTPGWFRIGRYLIRSSWWVLRRLAGGPNRGADEGADPRPVRPGRDDSPAVRLADAPSSSRSG